MSKHAFGLASVEMSDVASDGGLGTAWQTIGETVTDSASLTTTSPSTTDFKVEESDSPVESTVSDPGISSFAWSSFDISAANLVALYGGTRTASVPAGGVGSFGTIVGGSSYTNGTYTNVSLIGGTGTGAKATIVVSGGSVTSVTKTVAGSGYTIGDVLSALSGDIGGTGTGFSVPIATRTVLIPETWDAPDTIPVLYKSLRLTDKKGNVITIPRSQITTTLGLSFSKTKLGQVNMTAKILQPEKTGVKRYSIQYA
jgi:hypothetical protein